MWANVIRVRIKSRSHHWLIKALNFYHTFTVYRVCTTRPRHVYPVTSTNYISFDCAPRTTREERRDFTLYLWMRKSKNGGFCNRGRK